jgi:hypothetical protein
VLYENDFFPWITSDAIHILVEDGFLTSFAKTDIPNASAQFPRLGNIVFVVRTEPYQANPALVKTHAKNIAKLVNSYTDPNITRALGDHLEGLVKAEIRAHQFSIVATHTNQYRGRTWTTTGHNLDLVAEHASGSLNIGVEIKNTLDIMDAKEIDTKIDMCHFLGLVPVFAVRWMKPYIDCISNQGGFSWIFKTQIYPPGFWDFTHTLFAKLSALNRNDSHNHRLEFPIAVRTSIPERAATTFKKWTQRAIANPPQANPTARCGSH